MFGPNLTWFTWRRWGYKSPRISADHRSASSSFDSNSSRWRANQELEPIVGHPRGPDLAERCAISDTLCYTVFLVDKPDRAVWMPLRTMSPPRSFPRRHSLPPAVRPLRPPILLVQPPAGDRSKCQAMEIAFHNIRYPSSSSFVSGMQISLTSVLQ
jgi:hypothetical protein